LIHLFFAPGDVLGAIFPYHEQANFSV